MEAARQAGRPTASERHMDDSQENSHSADEAPGPGGHVPGGRSGQGAASAMEHLRADNERQQREQAGAQDEGESRAG